MATFTTVVLAVDGTADGNAAFPYAGELARLTEAQIVLVRVLETARPICAGDCRNIYWMSRSNPRLELPSPEFPLSENSNPEARKTRVRVVVRLGDPPDEIVAEAQRYSHAMIVLTSHGHCGLESGFFGSVATAVLRSSPIPVLVVRPGDDSMGWTDARLRDICVPLDGSQFAEIALEPAKELARAAGARLHLVHVVEIDQEELPRKTTDGLYTPSIMAMLEYLARMEKVADHYLRKTAADLRREGFTVTHDVLGGEPAHQLLTYIARTMPDLIVITSHWRTGVGQLLMGSVADRLVTESKLPLLIVRATERKPVRLRHARARLDSAAVQWSNN